jgi:hypothetical protein
MRVMDEFGGIFYLWNRQEVMFGKGARFGLPDVVVMGGRASQSWG